MTIDQTTIITSGILLLLAIISTFFNPFFRKLRKKEQEDNCDDGQQQQLPPITVLITAHDNAPELERNLPVILEQDYPAGYQVIVVAERGDSESEDVLKRLSTNSHLYYTLIPESSRYMSRKKLSVTLGVKAAANEWILITEPTCAPQSDKWLATMARHCNESNDMVIGYSNYESSAPLYYRFERLQTEYYSLCETQKGIAYRHSGSNLLFRKSIFLNGEGFRGNLNLVRGEYDFIVNKFAEKGNTATETSPEAWVREETPIRKAWKYRHLYYLETRKILSRSLAHRFLFNLDQSMLHLSFLASAAAVALSSLQQQWVITAAAAASILIMWIVRGIMMARAARMFGEHIPGILALPLQLAVVWHNIGYRMKYHLADKLDFTTHKL